MIPDSYSFSQKNHSLPSTSPVSRPSFPYSVLFLSLRSIAHGLPPGGWLPTDWRDKATRNPIALLRVTGRQ